MSLWDPRERSKAHHMLKDMLLFVLSVVVSLLCRETEEPPLSGPMVGNLALPTGWCHPALPRSIAVIYRGGTGRQDRRKHLERSLTPLFTLEISGIQTLFQDCFLISTSGLDLGCGGDVVCVCLDPRVRHSSEGYISNAP
jgi:hypothetical protein